MDDSEIVQLFRDRNETALSLTEKKHGKRCLTVANNILKNREDAEDCVNDAYLKLWELIPPHCPRCRESSFKSQGKTILIASHSAEDIDVLCDTVCEMDKGRLTNIR